MKEKNKDLFWMILILALLSIVIIVSGFFYVSLSLGSATGHVVVDEKENNAEKNVNEKNAPARADFTGFSVSIN